MNATATNFSFQDVVLLDDGNFSVSVREGAGDDATAPRGYLQHRCYEGVTTPDGYECVGMFEPEGSRWVARTDATYDPRTGADCRRLGRFASRVDAVAALWAARHKAHCRHRSD